MNLTHKDDPGYKNEEYKSKNRRKWKNFPLTSFLVGYATVMKLFLSSKFNLQPSRLDQVTQSYIFSAKRNP